MHAVLSYIDASQAKLARHPFLSAAADGHAPEAILAFAPRLADWASAFRLRVDGQGAPRCERRAADRDHASPAEGGACERLALTLIREANGIEQDELRLVFLLALESACELFFGSVAPALEARTAGARMLYGVVALGPELRVDAFLLVDRVFAAFARLFDGLHSVRPAPRAPRRAPRISARAMSRNAMLRLCS